MNLDTLIENWFGDLTGEEIAKLKSRKQELIEGIVGFLTKEIRNKSIEQNDGSRKLIIFSNDVLGIIKELNK